MTDNEIIKALEICVKGNCHSCPAHIFYGECTDKVRQMAVDLINRQKAEVDRLTEERDKAIKGFEEFARRSYLLNPFACKYCAHSIEDGRACLWKAEHEDEEEACLGRHFEYKGIVGEG